MKAYSNHTTEKNSFSAKVTQAWRLLIILPHLIAERSLLQNGFWNAYGSALFAGPAIWRWRKYAPFPRGVNCRMSKHNVLQRMARACHLTKIKQNYIRNFKSFIMIILKKYWLRTGFIAITFILGLWVFVNAMEKNADSSEIVAVNFAFSGDDPDEASYINSNSWQPASGSESCLGDHKPCVVEIDEPGINTPEQLASFLQDMANANEDVEAYIETRTLSRQD